MRWATRVFWIYLLALATACSHRAAPPEAQPPAAARATSSLGTLELSLSRTELTTVDRLEVRLTLETQGGVGADELQFSPQDAGWTVVSTSSGGPNIGTDGLVRTIWIFTLEPFLDGEYEVPSAGIGLRDATTTSTLITPPQRVMVTSVLAEGQSELSVARAPVEIAEQHDSPSTLPIYLLALGAAVLIVVAGIWWFIGRGRRTTRIETHSAPDMTARGQVRQIRRDLMRLCSERIGPVPPACGADEITALARGRLDRDQVQLLHHLLFDLDRLAYGPHEPRPEDIDGLRSDLKRLAVVEQEARV